MSAAFNIQGVVDLGCRSHVNPQDRRGARMEASPSSVLQCATACAQRSFNRITIDSVACVCYMESSIVTVVQNIDECNNLCPDGRCGTRDFINRFSFYDITGLRDSVQAAITSSISASAAAERSRTESISVSALPTSSLSTRTIESSTTTTSTIITSTLVEASLPTALSTQVPTSALQSLPTSQDPPFIRQTGGILMMLALAMLLVIAGVLTLKFYKTRRGAAKNDLPVFKVLSKRPSTDSVNTKPLSIFSARSSMNRAASAFASITRPSRAGSLTPTAGGGTLERSMTPMKRNGSVGSVEGSVHSDTALRKEDLVHQMFGLTSVMEESSKSGGSSPVG
ncbi:hypothetical protein HDU67_002033 [Dinochytrium kinnereticum]|nr:hypothetical protein HDU67_002033 [Dinochytrium kinnereticum]